MALICCNYSFEWGVRCQDLLTGGGNSERFRKFRFSSSLRQIVDEKRSSAFVKFSWNGVSRLNPDKGKLSCCVGCRCSFDVFMFGWGGFGRRSFNKSLQRGQWRLWREEFLWMLRSRRYPDFGLLSKSSQLFGSFFLPRCYVWATVLRNFKEFLTRRISRYLFVFEGCIF